MKKEYLKNLVSRFQKNQVKNAQQNSCWVFYYSFQYQEGHNKEMGYSK